MRRLFHGSRDERVDPLDERRPTEAFLVMGQIALHHIEDSESLVQVKGERRIMQVAADDGADILARSQPRGVEVVRRQSGTAALAEQPARLHEFDGGRRQCVGDAMVLHGGIAHEVGGVERAPMTRIVVGEGSSRGEDAPRGALAIVVPTHDERCERADHGAVGAPSRDELPLGKEPMMALEFGHAVGLLVGIDDGAEAFDGLEIGRRQWPDGDVHVGRGHRSRRLSSEGGASRGEHPDRIRIRADC